VLENTLDILFTLIFRKVLEKCSHQPETWSHAILDPHIRRSIELMHSDWAKNWTIESLAIELGLSRAGFAAKFKTAMGDTPVHYLTKLRMQKAMIMLSETDEKIEAIASRVGYKDAFGFSKSFKKMIGVPPKEFRAKDAAARRVLSGQNSQHR
jgi:transcriptional regulator GlxA family with amidase domain